MKRIRTELTREPAELYRILKFEGLAASGGEAKYFVSQGLVTVNGEVETRKRRKLYAGDEIGVGDTVIELVRNPAGREAQ